MTKGKGDASRRTRVSGWLGEREAEAEATATATAAAAAAAEADTGRGRRVECYETFLTRRGKRRRNNYHFK